MEKLAQKNRDKVIDLLAERLYFERESVKLYDKVLARMRRAMGEGGPPHAGDYTTYGLSGYRDDVFRGAGADIRREQGGAAEQRAEARVIAELLPRMVTCREQEKAHEEWVEQCIRRLGGDPRRRTEHARLTEREATGIDEVVKKDPELSHLFHALLAAEHLDYAGWDLLVALADEAGDLDAKIELETRLREEEQHLAFAREAVRIFAAHDVLEEEYPSPALGGGPGDERR